MACVVRSCKSSYRNLKDNPGIISFHRFPSDPDLKLRWLKNIGRADWFPPKNARVCSLHFENTCYKNNLQKKILRICAVPTIFENQAANVQQETYNSRSRVPRKPQSMRTLTSNISEPTKFSSHSQAPKKPKKRTYSETVSSALPLHSVASTSHQVASNALIAASTSQTDASTTQPVASIPQLELLSTIPKKKPRHANKTKSTLTIHASASTLKTALDDVPISRVLRNISNSETEDNENTVPSQNTGVKKSNEAAILVSSTYHLNEKIRQLESKLAHYKQLSERRGRKLKNVSRKYSRLIKKTASLATIITELKQRNMDSENIKILENAVDCPAQIFARYLMKAEGSSLPKQYPEEIKKFAVTLQFLSPRAYDYVRNTFNVVLPHPKTMSKWYQSIDCEPGFTTESFDTIKLRCTEATQNNKTLYCALSMDEMAIRKQLQWDGKKVHGYISIDSQDDNLPLASEAITFVITCINESWKIPVGYFFINGITGSQKANLVKQCITLLNETGIKTISLTFDGAAANASMATELGCNLDPDNLTTTFKVGSQEVVILYDPCHNIKLVRNALGEKKSFIDDKGDYISWHYLQSLQNVQELEGLRAGNKMTAAHINYHKQKMKVKLASQLLSNSVADSLEFLQKLNIEEFQNCDATIRFIKTFNDLFDILNSRNMAAKGFKKPLCSFNIGRIRTKLLEIRDYINSLKTSDGTLLVQSKRKTGFLGFKICIESILSIYDKYFALDPNLSFLPTHKLSQDHVEIFFAAIRSLGGYNNNPSAKAFITAYKKLLVHAEFKISGNANCLPLENINILHAKSTSFIKNINETCDNMKLLDVDECEDTFYDLDHDYCASPSQLTEYAENVIYYISGFIIRNLQEKIVCQKCNELLTAKTPNSHTLLVDVKNKGGLIKAPSQVAAICKYSEKVLRKHIKLNGVHNVGEKNKYSKIVTEIFALCGHNGIFSNSDHGQDHGFLDNHINLLIKAIINYNLKIRIHFECKKVSTPSDYVRNFLTKTITFKGQ